MRLAVLLMILAANFTVAFLVLALGVAFAEVYGSASAAETSSLSRMFETWGQILAMGADAMSELQERSVIAPALVIALSILPAVVVAPALRMDPAGGRGWSLKASAAAVVLLGSLGALGILVAVWEVVVLAVAPPAGEISREMLWLDWPVVLIVAWLASGAVVAWLLRRAGSADPSDRIARMVQWLFVGTGVELAIARRPLPWPLEGTRARVHGAATSPSLPGPYLSDRFAVPQCCCCGPGVRAGTGCVRCVPFVHPLVPGGLRRAGDAKGSCPEHLGARWLRCSQCLGVERRQGPVGGIARLSEAGIVRVFIPHHENKTLTFFDTALLLVLGGLPWGFVRSRSRSRS